MTKIANNSVVVHQGATLAERLEAIREDANERHAQALSATRSTVDSRIVELVQHRALAAVDAVLLA